MAAQGKKGKKSKGKTLNLTDFLAAGSNADDSSTTVVLAPTSSWADEMDEYDDSHSYGSSNRHSLPQQIVLPTAPRAALGPDISDDRIPREPPFTAYVANLPYDILEEDLMKFFSKLKIKGVRLPRDGDAVTGRLKGFGYADFEDRESLVEALSMNDHLVMNRKIRVNLATHAGKGDRDNDRGGFGNRRGGGRYDNNRDGDEGGEDRTAGDWRSGPPPEPRRDDRTSSGRDYERRGGGGSYNRNRDYNKRDQYNNRDYYDDRRDNNRGFGFDRQNRDEHNFDRSQLRSNEDQDRDRREAGFNRRSADRDVDSRDGGRSNGYRDSYDRRDNDRSGGYDRGGSRGGGYERRDGYDRDRRDGYDRDRRGGGGGGGRYERRDDRNASSEAPKERPRLQLAKRSVPVEATKEEVAVNQPSIFGGAKPVNTAKKEMEIEEKLKAVAIKEDEPPKKPSASSIFGGAKPVDTTAKEKEIEEKLLKREEEKGQKDEKEGEKGRRIHSGDRNDNRPHSRGSGGNSRGANAHSRGGPRDRRDYDRRDNDRRDYDRRDSDRRDNDRRDSDRRDNDRRDSDRRDNRRPERSPPPMKKADEEKAPAFAVPSKFSYLADEDENNTGTSGQDSE